MIIQLTGIVEKFISILRSNSGV